MSIVEYEDKPDDKTKDRSETVSYWLNAIEAATNAEEDWRKEADGAVNVYRGDKDADNVFARSREFNIFHSNIETTLPAIYNSTPVPDVRRRFGDKDGVARVVSQLLERNLSYAIDSYDFDETMRTALFDASVAGRGVIRVRYKPYFTEMAPTPGEAEDNGESYPEAPEAPEGVANVAQPEPNEALSYEEVCCEYVPWKRFRMGPADDWSGVPWIAFEHLLSREEIKQLCGDDEKKAYAVSLDCKIGGDPAGSDDESQAPKSDITRRARVWEIWDREEGKVIFIASGYATEPLLEEDDPLGLEGFYPIPRPIQWINTPGNMVPVCPYSIYRSLVEELNEITFRIKRLVRQIRVRGGYAGGQSDINSLAMADDGELVPFANLEMLLADNGDINKMLLWWPIEPQVKALSQLYQQREQVKQTIYEVTGISDIVRGASKASETATAQEIKNQWGSLRIQKMQQEVQRFARDLFRLKAEIIATKFQPETVMMVAGVQLMPAAQKQALQAQMQAMEQQGQQPGQPGQPAPQAPQLPPEMQKALNEPSIEDVFGVMQSDMMRAYRVDIESDSTVRGDLTRNQKSMGDFLAGTAQYIGAVGPAVQAGQMDAQVAVEIFSAFSRNFKLGKQVEDALEKMAESAAKPKPPKPDPEMEKNKAQMQLEQQKAQVQQQNDAAKLQLEQRKMEMQAANEQTKAQSDMAIAQQKMQFEMELAREKAAQEYQLRMMEVNADIEIKREMAAQQAQLNTETSRNKMVIAANEAEQRAKFKGATQ
jgi:hypothetical protein